MAVNKYFTTYITNHNIAPHADFFFTPLNKIWFKFGIILGNIISIAREYIKFEKEISIDNQYLFTVKQNIINDSQKTYNFYPYGQIIRNEIPEITNFFILHEGPLGVFDSELVEKDYDDIQEKKYDDYKVTRTIEIECDTLANQLTNLNINNLDYLKIDTQGAEFEILKGLGNFRPLLIKIEAHFFSMYKNVPSWHKLINLLYELNYVLIDLKDIGDHSTRIPAEADMIFIPNFNSEVGKELIMSLIHI